MTPTKPEDALVELERLRERLLDHARNVGGDDSFERLYGDEACAIADAITTLLERERALARALDEAEAYLAAGAGWGNAELENPIVARACGMGCRDGLERLRKARAALTGEAK